MRNPVGGFASALVLVSMQTREQVLAVIHCGNTRVGVNGTFFRNCVGVLWFLGNYASRPFHAAKLDV